MRLMPVLFLLVGYAAIADDRAIHPDIVTRASEIVQTSSQFTGQEKRSLLLGLDRLDHQKRLGGVASGIVLSLPGTPVAPVLCLRGRPLNFIEIETCAIAALSIVGFTQAVKIQFDLVNTRSVLGKGQQLSLGPAAGAKAVWVCVPLMGCGFAAGPELFAALQYVAWLSNHLGVSVEIDFGANVKWTSSARGST